MNSYPVNLVLVNQKVLVVGGGPVAAHKATGLITTGARITVVAPVAVDSIKNNQGIVWKARHYQEGEVANYRLVIAATNDPWTNALVKKDADKANIFVNSADDPVNCTFTLPAVARRGEMQIAISTNGRSPGLARWMRQQFEADLDNGYGQLLSILVEARAEARAEFGTSEIPGWEDALNSDLLQIVREGRLQEAREKLRGHLGLGERVLA